MRQAVRGSFRRAGRVLAGGYHRGMEPVEPDDDQQPIGVRRNTILALVFLLIAIAVAGTLGVIRIYQMGPGG